MNDLCSDFLDAIFYVISLRILIYLFKNPVLVSLLTIFSYVTLSVY